MCCKGGIKIRAVILAAGRSTRLYPITLEKPKCLLKIGDKTLIEHQIEALNSCGIEDILVVLGYHAKQIKELLGNSVSYILNKEFATTNNIYSLWCASDELKGKAFVCLYSDVLFDKTILKDCLEKEGDIILAVETDIVPETCRVTIKEGQIKSISKEIPDSEASGNFIGISKFSESGSESLFAEIERTLQTKENMDVYFIKSLDDLINKGQEIYYSEVKGRVWIDIDTKDDLEKAINNVSKTF